MRILEAKAVISAQDRTGGVFNAVAAKVKRLERASAMQGRAAPLLERAGRATSNWGNSMMVAAGGLGAIGGAIVGSKIKDAVVDYAALDRQMNRIGITAGASEQETSRATDSVKKMAEDMKMPLDQAVSGLDALVSSGKSMQEAMEFLPSVLATAQASGAATADMAKSASAMALSLKVPAKEMQGAFDALVTGGKLGMFELRDMAEYMPKVAASAQKMGLLGVDGVQRLTGMLQISRQVSGTAEQAATGVTDAFEKLLSPTVLKAAAKQGHDFKKIMIDAEKQGKNSFEAVVEYLRDKTKGTDLEKNLLLSSIFSESDSRRFVVAMMKNWDEYQKFLKEIRSGTGSVAKDLSRVLNDAQAQLTEAQTKLNNAALAVGQRAMPVVTEFLERADLEIQLFKEQMASLDGWMKKTFGFGFEDFQKASGLGGPSNEDVRGQVERMKQERENPALKRVHQLEQEQKALKASIDGDQKHVEALKGYGYTPEQIAAEVPSYAAYKAKMEELDRLLAAARLNALIASGGRRPGDAGDRAEERQAAIDAAAIPDSGPSKRRAPLPFKVPYREGAGAPMPVPVPFREGGDGPIKAVVDGPVQVSGQAEVKVTVTVDPSALLLATLKEAQGNMRIQSAPTGRSMPEAEPPSRGSSGGIGAR